MRKVLLSFLIGCLGFISGFASTSISMDGGGGEGGGGGNTTPINDGGFTILTLGRPLVPPLPDLVGDVNFPSSEYFYCLVISPGADWGQFIVIIENLTTGESEAAVSDSNSAKPFFTPFAIEDGIWRLNVCSTGRHKRKILSKWDFTLDHGIITIIN